MKAIRRLLEECEKCSYDTLGFIHYIPKEIYHDAKEEFQAYERRLLAQRTQQGDL
jgi:hypothetical protein